MTDEDAAPPANLRPRRAARHAAPLYHDAETTTATAGSPLNALGLNPTIIPSTADAELSDHTPPNPAAHNPSEKRSLAGALRSRKQRSSGGFLLADGIISRQNSSRLDKPPNTHVQHETYPVARHDRHTAPPRTSSSSKPGPGPDPGNVGGLGIHSDESSTFSASMKRDSLAGDTAVGSSPHASAGQLDMESAQIVNMALNLSESRKLAARRNISQPAPPKLAPLPDNAPRGSLSFYLQQQRKASRTGSPRPDRSPRIGGTRVLSSLQPAFEAGGSYRYHISQSTLARAQKAKEHLELMAQYRRLLELVPPLEPVRNRPWTASPPSTPNGSASVSRVATNESETRIGRPYNPLQYIRNRKVRARERKTIDGQAQGFNDVLRVSEWIDEVAKWVATGQSRVPGNPSLPPFSGAQEPAPLQASPPPNGRTPAAVTKPKRPRVDWVIDPADMLADVYWLELDDNKRLVEDRHWRRVFPQKPEYSLSRPLSRDEPAPRLATPDAQTLAEKPIPDPPSSRHEHEHVLSAARDRAQQKLRALKGAHHRRASSIANLDLLRLHRSSVSESSDTDSDRRRRMKGSVSSSNPRSVLEKQMEEMIAQEQRDVESHPLYDHEAMCMKSTPMTPERDLPQSHRRAESRADLSEPENKARALKPLPVPHSSPPGEGRRTSLEVPRRRFSVDEDTSPAHSPDLRPVYDLGMVPPIGTDLSPMSTRPSSPSRNPLSVVKSIFRERSKERIAEAHSARDDGLSPLSAPSDAWINSPDTAGSGVSSPQRKPSRSPVGERVSRHRSHKSITNSKLRGEDGGVSLRSLLRGPRIDTVLRSGVSKVSDMIWRKESGAEDEDSSTSDDSEAEARGRSPGPRIPGRGQALSPQDGKSIPEAASQLLAGDHRQLLNHPPSRPLSRRSSRFELLKPPRIDIQSASPNVSPPPLVDRHHENVRPDDESDGSRDHTSAANGSLNGGLSYPQPPRPQLATARQWSITDRRLPPTRSTASKREIARLRALLLSAGIHAMEIDRRAKQPKPIPPLLLPAPPPSAPNQPFEHTPARAAPQTDLYPLAARALTASIDASASDLHAATSRFSADAVPGLARRVDLLREKVAGELAALAQQAADAADEANHDLVVGQRLKVKRVVDVMEKMLRRRRRRFRWVRRAGWLVVEWLLVGCMWYVWFVVMIARLALGVGKGVVRGVRWFLWL
ncbi:hypothetical protein VTK26DRAFT_2432 [Humicola hyalothermophila]